MNKETFTMILQAALWHYEGMGEKELIKKFNGYNPKLIRAGIALCDYLIHINPEDENAR